MATEPTDEQILSDPSAFTVDQVLAAFEDATPEQVAAAQTLEQAGKGRIGIAEYSPPAAPGEATFSRDRVLGPEGPRIVGGGVKAYVIAGALHGDDSESFTAGELRGKVAAFLTRPVTQEA